MNYNLPGGEPEPLLHDEDVFPMDEKPEELEVLEAETPLASGFDPDPLFWFFSEATDKDVRKWCLLPDRTKNK